ncbi:hypothetical protein X946_2536 [Burkholderia sp. ABCPW 111]|nr:hypothetical protein X946_2536 [Burkholderia sp. ABCPW 111]
MAIVTTQTVKSPVKYGELKRLHRIDAVRVTSQSPMLCKIDVQNC